VAAERRAAKGLEHLDQIGEGRAGPAQLVAAEHRPGDAGEVRELGLRDTARLADAPESGAWRGCWSSGSWGPVKKTATAMSYRARRVSSGARSGSGVGFTPFTGAACCGSRGCVPSLRRGR
jgi:hypothetical protein